MPDLSLTTDAEMFDELKKRYGCRVFIGKKMNIDFKGGEITVDAYQGSFNECAGLAMEASMKQTYFKLATGQPTKGF